MLDTIFLDMDGVCCDFLSAALKRHKLNPQEVFARWPAGTFDVCRVLDMTPANFWHPLQMDMSFWQHLEPYDWFGNLYAALNEIDGAEVIFLTSPSDCATSFAGKQLWLRNRGIGNSQIVMTPRKELLAGPRRLLIDDHDGHVAEFALRGGHAITFPQRWNSHHELADDSRVSRVIRQVRHLARTH